MWPRIIGRNEVLISVASGCGDFSEEVLSAEHMEGQWSTRFNGTNTGGRI